MKLIKYLLAGLAALALASCGGGGGSAGTPGFGGGGGSTPVDPTAPVASDIAITLSSTSLSNSGTDAVTVTVTAVDGNRNTVAGIPVSLAIDSDATIAVSAASTGTDGTVTGTVRVGSNKINRVLTVTASSGSLTRQAQVQVVGTRITASALPPVLAPSEAGRVQFRVVDATGNALASAPLTITGPGGVTSNASTNASGDFEYSYTAPAAAGPLDIRATSGSATATATVVVVSGPGTIPPVLANSVRSSSVSASPQVVAINSGTTTDNRTDIRALFVGDDNAPIRNVRVRFDLDGDSNSIGGTFSTGTSMVYSDESGIAISSYRPGTRFSPTDGVTIRACWDYNDFAEGSCPNATRTTLTVISDALSVSIGTDEFIVTGDLTYVKRFVVQVNDSSGLAKADVLISPLLDLPGYRKGYYEFLGGVWVQNIQTNRCDNEDVNRNGVLEVYSNGHEEDANGNSELDPRKADVAVSFEGSSRTNALGQVVLRMTYLRNAASWVYFDMQVSASGVAGTEGRASYAGILPVPASVLEQPAAPAFEISPYGTGASEFVPVTVPGSSVPPALLCRPLPPP